MRHRSTKLAHILLPLLCLGASNTAADSIFANPAFLPPTDGLGPSQLVELWMAPGEATHVFPANVLVRTNGGTVINDIETHPVGGIPTEVEDSSSQEVEFNIGGEPFEDYAELPFPDFDPPDGPQKFATLTITTGIDDEYLWLHPVSTHLVITWEGTNAFVINKQFENVGENLFTVGPDPSGPPCFPVKGTGGKVIVICL